jgi:hypothetical protein
MTESEWMTCDDPKRLMDYLKDIATERKARLYCCGCCRRVWQSFLDGRSRMAVETAEQYADGQATHEEMSAVGLAAERAKEEAEERCGEEESPENILASLATYAASVLACSGKMGVQFDPRFAGAVEVVDSTIVCEDSGIPGERRAQSALIRCVFGNPFRPTSVNFVWLTASAVSLAQAIYDERAFERLPMLANALESAGCSNQDILGHCRGPGPHARGCWVVDLLLQKS